jgi:glucose/arabinose dehydrogenase
MRSGREDLARSARLRLANGKSFIHALSPLTRHDSTPHMKFLALTAAFTLPLAAQVATIHPPADPKKQIDWDHMDLGPFFSGCYSVNGTTSFKGVAVAVGTKDSPATMLYDTELLRFHAAWDGGLASFARGRGGLEGTIKSDGDVKLGAGWALGWGAEIKSDPRERHQGAAAGVRWNGVFVNGPHTVLSYSVDGQNVMELPGSELSDGIRVFTRTITAGPGAAKQVLLVEAPGTPKPGGAGELLIEKDGNVVGVALRGTVQGGKIVSQQNGRIVFQLPKLAVPATFQIALAAAPAADAAKLSAALNVKAKLASVATLTQKPGPARWGAALTSAGKLGDGGAAYAADEIPFPSEDPFKSWFRPGGHDFLADGTCAVANMSGDVWLVSGLDADLKNVRWKRFAAGLFQPLGCKVVDGKIYVLGRDRITRLHDLNNDGEADYYESFNSDCIVTDNYHEFALDLQTDAAGNFYYAKGSPWTPTCQSPHQGTMIKVSKDGKKLEVFATGLRAPNGLGMGPGDVLTVSDNQGHWMPANRLNIVKPGGFYGMVTAAHKPLTFKRADGTEFKANPSEQAAREEHKTNFYEGKAPIPVEGYDLPLAWLPMDIDNSPGGEVWTPKTWGPWGGRMLHMSYGKSTLYGVTMETVDGVQQGGFVKFPLKFSSGIQRGRFSPADGQLYLTGLKVWQSNAAKDGCFYRVRHTGKPITMPVNFATKASGVEIAFSGPLAESAAETAGWSAEQWNYKWTGGYGSPDMSVIAPGKPGKDIVLVNKVTLSADKKTATLELADRLPAHTLRIKLNVKAADGSDVKYDLNNTIHRIPGQRSAATQ